MNLFRSGIRRVNLENPTFHHQILFSSILVHLELLSRTDIKEAYERVRNIPSSSLFQETFKDVEAWEKYAKYNHDVDCLFEVLGSNSWIYLLNIS